MNSLLSAFPVANAWITVTGNLHNRQTCVCTQYKYISQQMAAMAPSPAAALCPLGWQLVRSMQIRGTSGESSWGYGQCPSLGFSALVSSRALQHGWAGCFMADLCCRIFMDYKWHGFVKESVVGWSTADEAFCDAHMSIANGSHASNLSKQPARHLLSR